MKDTNRVVVMGRLVRDPELRQTRSGQTVCEVRIANNERVKNGDDWEDKANFFDVTVWGRTAEAVSRLSKGKRILVDGRLSWREWNGEKGRQQKVWITAEQVQFVDPKDQGQGTRREEPQPDFGAEFGGGDGDDFQQPGGDSDIPF